jgi:hydroxymethylpyrimidine/phosphomethylpyrimidine kinase
VEGLIEAGIGPLVPEVGTNVAGATPYAERPDETAAVEGRITQTLSGASPNRGVRFGASTHVATALLAAREADPGLRVAANYRHDDTVAAALDATDVPVATVERPGESDGDTAESARVPRAAVQEAVADTAETPVAVVDPASPVEEMVYVLASGGDELLATTRSILDGFST